MSTKYQPPIAVDLGGVIRDTWPANQTWLQKHGFNVSNTPLSKKFVQNMTGGFLYEQMKEEIYDESEIFNLKPVSGSLDVIKILHRKYKIILYLSF